MFRSARGSSGLGGLVAVAVVIASYLSAAGVMWKAYSDGAKTGGGTELVCVHGATPGVKC